MNNRLFSAFGIESEDTRRLLQENWSWYFALGLSLVALGMLAIVYAFFSTIVSVVYIGFLVAAVGLFEGYQAFRSRFWGGFFLHAVLSILYTVGGLFIAFHPAVNAITLTLLLAIFFIVSGIFKLAFVAVQQVPHKGWLILNGIATLTLGILIWYQWPVSSLWVIGTIVGVNMMITGWTWIMLALAARDLEAAHKKNS